MKKRVAVAVVSKPHGIHGQVKLKSLGDEPSELLELTQVYLEEDAKDAVKINKSWQYKKEVCMELEGVISRDEAEKLRGKYLYIDMSEMPPLQEGRFYLNDLVGCIIEDDNGEKLGDLKEIFQHGAADVYSVKGAKNFMMPALKRVIISVDIKAKVIVVKKSALDEVIVYED